LSRFLEQPLRIFRTQQFVLARPARDESGEFSHRSPEAISPPTGIRLRKNR
jgi:hypothetical protein